MYDILDKIFRYGFSYLFQHHILVDNKLSYIKQKAEKFTRAELPMRESYSRWDSTGSRGRYDKADDFSIEAQ